jgi:hypothetical protein
MCVKSGTDALSVEVLSCTASLLVCPTGEALKQACDMTHSTMSCKYSHTGGPLSVFLSTLGCLCTTVASSDTSRQSQSDGSTSEPIQSKRICNQAKTERSERSWSVSCTRKMTAKYPEDGKIRTIVLTCDVAGPRLSHVQMYPASGLLVTARNLMHWCEQKLLPGCRS